MATKRTIGQLARSLGVDAAEVSKAARQIVGLPAGNARDVHYLLTPHQCQQIEASLRPPAPMPASTSAEGDGATYPPSDPPLEIRSDPPAARDGLEFGCLNYGLWVHPEVSDALHDQAQLRKRLGIVLQHLGAHGRTSVVKGCSDDKNKGWLRSPLGGNNGMQYYLWWAPQGGRPAKALDLPSGDILVRAVRHHDDHNLLDAGKLHDYLEFTQREIEDETLVGRPWTDEQLQFISADDPVRLVLGRPGSGKTTVLWKAVDARSGHRVLYLTWSRDLTRYAREHFSAFAASDVHVDARDFVSFLGEICRVDVKRLTLHESRAAFSQAINRLPRNILGPWAGKEAALFAELRAFVFGCAIPGDEWCAGSDELSRLDDATYVGQRGDPSGVGRFAAESLVKALGTIRHEEFEEIFPEFVAAAKAIERLRHDDVPDGFLDFDRVVVDEVQDLTLLEAAVFVEFCRAVARCKGHAPWLLVAGDEGQTVRPSGFDWGPFSDLIARRVGTPRKFQLQDNLRCPAKIAGVIERASKSYAHLEKGRRPAKQGHRSGGQHVDAHLFHVDVQSVPEAVDLLERLEDVEGVVVLSPQNDVPPWVPEHLRDAVLTPADAKGLEYQSVVLLDPGKLLARLTPSALDLGAAELEEHARRTTIDQLRVALSRATETLAFVDVEASDAERNLSWELLDTPAPFDPEDLVEHFTDVDAPPEERVLARTKDARALIDERPRRAWLRAFQAMRLLGDRSLPNGVATESVRVEAYRTLLATAARLLVDGTPAGVHRPDVIDAADVALKALDTPDEKRAFRQLNLWSAKTSTAPFSLLDATHRMGAKGEWIRTALVGVAQVLRRTIEECAGTAPSAKEFAGDVGAWLALTGFAGDATGEARRLRCTAVDTLLSAQELGAAEAVLARVEPVDAMRTGRLREAQGRHEDAAEAFETAGAPEDALRNWREAGNWERALSLARGRDEAQVKDLGWLVDLQNLRERLPAKLTNRLTKGDEARLSELLREIQSTQATKNQGAR